MIALQERFPALTPPAALAGLAPDTPLCVALSGGADSTALLCLLAGTPGLCAVHVHHGIRGDEADRDAAFCAALCARLGVELTTLHINAPALAKAQGVSLETAARNGRYEAITAHLRERKIPLLVTAHHADDQLETLLQHLLRGSGLKGLGGIPPCRPLAEGILVVRPLLAVSRRELTSYLNEIGQSFVEDSTNGEGCCTRNRLRLEVAPVLEELYPGAARNAARAAESLREDEAFLAELAPNYLQGEGDAPALATLAALPRPVFARVMRTLLPDSLERLHVDALWELCQAPTPHATLDLPGARVSIEGGRLQIAQRRAPVADYALTLHEGENPLPCGGTVWVLPTGSEPPFSPTVHRFVVKIPLCSSKIKGALCARNLRPGDRLRAGGVNRAVRRLAGSEIPLSTRATMPLLADDGGVLACPFGKNHNVRDDAYSKEGCDVTVYLAFD